MTPEKSTWIRTEASIQRVKVHYRFRLISSIMFVVFIAVFTSLTFAQINKDTVTSPPSADDTYNQILDYSRPGEHHQLLADLVGTWTSKGRHFNWIDSDTSDVALEFSATAVRKSFANGRYFIVDVISDGTLEMPIQNGKMKEVKYQGLEIEGYDNVKKKFIKNTIGNHLYSSIGAYEGIYDPKAKTIVFNSEFEPLPGMIVKDQFLFIFIDKNHYKWEYYQEQNGKLRLATEIHFSRVLEK